MVYVIFQYWNDIRPCLLGTSSTGTKGASGIPFVKPQADIALRLIYVSMILLVTCESGVCEEGPGAAVTVENVLLGVFRPGVAL